MKEVINKQLIIITYLESVISEKYNVEDILLKETGTYNILKNIKATIENILKITVNENNTQSIISLSRNIIDYYSIYFLFNHYHSNTEQLIRYYIYLIDSYKTLIKTQQLFLSLSSQQNKLKFETIFNDLITKEEKSIVNLKTKILNHDFEKYCKEENINNGNWKFKNKINKDKFGWKELYEFSINDDKYVILISNYFSMYTHGLGIINIKSDNQKIIEGTFGYISFVLNKFIEELNSKHGIGL
ncbi:MAG: hypothetical protein ACRYFA_10290 [Janthinobacterium lividum]